MNIDYDAIGHVALFVICAIFFIMYCIGFIMSLETAHAIKRLKEEDIEILIAGRKSLVDAWIELERKANHDRERIEKIEKRVSDLAKDEHARSQREQEK